MSRPKPPPLSTRLPDCSMCGRETEWDEGFVCRVCGAYWSERGLDTEDGQWLNPDEPQCRKILHHGNYPILSGRCILTDGHETDHWNGNIDWRSGKQMDWRTATETEAVDLVKR